MLLVIILSLHILLILLYAIAIELKLSRHTYVHLLFAAVVPFVGELCLFVSEFGRTEAFQSEKLFGKEFSSEETQSDDTMTYSIPVSRETLLKAIESKPKNLVDILHHGVETEDIEVAHISAATIMKMQREYENRISALREKHLHLPDNMEILRAYIETVGEYYASGLLQGEAAEELLTLQEELLNCLLNVLPRDESALTMLSQNQAEQQRSRKDKA